MVRWWFTRLCVPLAAFGLAVNCSVDDEDGYVFGPETSVGAGGEDGDEADGPAAGKDGSGAVSAGGESSGGQPDDGDAGNRSGESGGASSSLGGSSGGSRSSATAGNGGNSGGTVSNPGNGGSAGGTDGTTTGSGGSSVPADCDCEDPACGARVCVPAAPAQWSGPILLYEGSAGRLPECTGEADDQHFNGGTVPVQEELRCYACGCGELTGATCSLRYATYTDSSCQNQTSSVTLSTTCNVPVDAPYFTFDSFVLTGGCTPEGGTEASRSGPRWESVVRGCGLSDPRTAGCGNGSVCMPEPSSPFEDEICVYRVGDHVCPSNYSSKRSYTMSLNDERECAPCSCVPSGTCSAHLTVYNHEQCTVDSPDYTSQNVGIGSPEACLSINSNIPVVAMRLTGAAVPGNCSPVLPLNSTLGSILGEDPLTVCCQ